MEMKNNESIKIKFEIKQGNETFKVGDYVEIHFKDKEKYEVIGGNILNDTNSIAISIFNEVGYKELIPYWKIEEIRHI
ncbi:MAG: hypothetical protein K2F59_02455 [Eubacteriales bacterium]|nr:hypothetical protein [Eubacteriales bacterium]